MVEDRRDPADVQDALEDAFERTGVRPVATRTRVPDFADLAAGGAADREESAGRAESTDADQSTDAAPIYPRTRVP